ncbi:DNA polymerase/3'-5' exonuclease PolX [Patescibacteria group bacterium AH-259-L07]|nr:DNA polymerase/3'-5' exonuclease PolX [Patescibacteria group bacterium AH-259-L07]
MDNREIANILNQIADILEIIDANRFRIIAHQRAAQAIENLTENINSIYAKGELEKIPGVGKAIADHIKELIETGKSKAFERLKKKIPVGVLELLYIEGLGPKKVKLFYQKFGVKSIPQLEKLVKSHKLLILKGWGEKSEQNILRGIALYKRFRKRFALGEVYFLSHDIVTSLKQSRLTDKVTVCGSIRRGRETIGDMDILATSKTPKKAIDFFTSLDAVEKVIAQGTTKARVILRHGPEADLRVVKPESFGAAMHYFTGSKAHNIHIRKMGIAKGLRINEYGVYKKSRGKLIRIGGRAEKEIFQSVGLDWIPPEIREDDGEIEAAQKGKLPKLINAGDVKGDLQVHTKWSDADNTILEMAQAAKERGYEYIAITDHASAIGVTKGLNKKTIVNYIKAIKRADKKINGIRILAGSEVDIMRNGDLYLPDSVLKRLDVVLAAVHSGFRRPEVEQTRRVIKVLENPYVHIFAHPTARLINKREPINLDMETVIQAAKKTNTILEINASWQRLDLNAIHTRSAVERGVKMVISTDAHATNQLDMMKFGVLTARRGWCEKKDIINTLPLTRLLKVLTKK